MQQQAAAALAAQQHSTDKLTSSISRGEAISGGGVVQQLVHQIQHQPHTSTSSQRASTSMSGLR